MWCRLYWAHIQTIINACPLHTRSFMSTTSLARKNLPNTCTNFDYDFHFLFTFLVIPYLSTFTYNSWKIGFWNWKFSNKSAMTPERRRSDVVCKYYECPFYWLSHIMPAALTEIDKYICFPIYSDIQCKKLSSLLYCIAISFYRASKT